MQTTTSLSGSPRARPLAPLMLFLAESDADEPDLAARDAAVDLGRRLDRPVLLLDCAAHANAQYTHFQSRHALRPRPAPHSPAAGQAVFLFHPLRDSQLWVTSITPSHAATDELFWTRQADDWPQTRLRLLDLFGAVVIAVPSLLRSPRGLAFAARVDATILVVRDGPDISDRADRMRSQMTAIGGRPAGIVLTGCAPDRQDLRPARRRKRGR